MAHTHVRQELLSSLLKSCGALKVRQLVCSLCRSWRKEKFQIMLEWICETDRTSDLSTFPSMPKTSVFYSPPNRKTCLHSERRRQIFPEKEKTGSLTLWPQGWVGLTLVLFCRVQFEFKFSLTEQREKELSFRVSFVVGMGENLLKKIRFVLFLSSLRAANIFWWCLAFWQDRWWCLN